MPVDGMTMAHPVDQSIHAAALAHWQAGDALRAWLGDGDSYPFTIDLPAGDAIPLTTTGIDRLGWVHSLETASKCHAGHGYRIEYVDAAATARRPVRVVFDEPIDLIRYLGREEELRRFLQLARDIRSRFPALRRWIERQPMEVLAAGDAWPAILERLQQPQAAGAPLSPQESELVERLRAVLAAAADGPPGRS